MDLLIELFNYLSQGSSAPVVYIIILAFAVVISPVPGLPLVLSSAAFLVLS